MSKKKEDTLVNEVDDSTVVVTSAQEEIDRKSTNLVKNALASHDPQNTLYSAYLNLTGTANTLTVSQIETYAENAQSDLDKVVSLNNIIRKQVNMDDLIGMVVQSVTNNINTEYTLSYKNFGTVKSKNNTLNKVRELVNDFNEQIRIKRVIRQAVELVYMEGNYNCMLRNNGENWAVDFLPLGVCEMSGYEDNGRPVVLVNMASIKEALQKTMQKDRKGNPLFFKDTKEEIENNYPQEIIDAYNNNATYAKLDVNYTGTCRINNRGRQYGLSPIVRALSPAIMLQNFYTADAINAKSKSKKIIHQVMRKEVLGNNGTNKGFEIMAYAHQQLMKAWSNPTVVYTSPPAVEKIVYVEPTTDEISTDKVKLYRNKVLSSLGVAFLTNDTSQTASTANINLKQLLQCINAITEQVEDMLHNFYRTLLTVNGYDLVYCPTIKIIDSEMLEMDLRINLSSYLYNTLNCSRETALGVVGVDVEDELHKRERENEDGLNDIFTPYSTAYTKSSNSNDDGSSSEDTTNQKQETTNEEKQSYDEEYNKTRK